MRIDSHNHFWRYRAEEFGWITEDMTSIRRDFLPHDLQPELREAGFVGTVAVQARQSVAETEWLLQLADENPFVAGVVGWLPLAAPELRGTLERFASYKKLKGVRHIVQDEADDNYILSPDFNKGVTALREFDLVYDILIFERHLPQTIQFVDLHPDQVFVLDHIGKPQMDKGDTRLWSERMKELARRQNVYCKLSGMATETGRADWTEEKLTPFFAGALEAFGPQRLLFGSDWPVVLVVSSYARWAMAVQRFIGQLSPGEQQSIMGDTATRVYKL